MNPSRQITPAIADWVNFAQAKPGVAFGNVKTHKPNNPLRLITSCCGTAIERLSAYTEHFLKPLAQKAPSFIKDTSDLLNKIARVNEQGPLPPNTLLVSWDVVSMFPNIDNNLGVSAVRKALDSRSTKFPSTDCIVEATEICLEHNNSQFLDKNVLQCHGTAMGPKNACSYADIAMSEIDRLAKTAGKYKPSLWWRYRDDIIDFWTEGLPALHEFTEFLNQLYPTIKFELVVSESKLNVLDLTLHLIDGFIYTDVYSKPSDSHLYLPPSSAHPSNCKRSIPYGVALRLKRNCSTQEFLDKRNKEYKAYLIQQGYDETLVEESFTKVEAINRSDLLKPKGRNKRTVVPLVLDYNPNLPDIGKIIRNNLTILHANDTMREIFPDKSIIAAYRRPKNLKELLAPSRLRPVKTRDPGDLVQQANLGCHKCSNRCDLCTNYFTESPSFRSFATRKIYHIKQNLNCSSSNVIYLASCNKCKLQYVGSTSTQFKVRFRNHKSAMLTNKNTCEVAIHFNNSPHSLSDFSFMCIEAITDTPIQSMDSVLLTREAYWSAQLFTLKPFGLNKRQEYKSSKRINFH